MAVTELTVPVPHAPAAVSDPVPPLENGDCLTRPEFERRYHAMPHVKKAELVEGVVYMPSPVGHGKHGKPHAFLVGWLVQYFAATPGVEIGDNSSVRLDLDNMPQPDVFLMIPRVHGGQASVDEDDFIAGAPELVVEVAASSVSYDLHDKLDAYRRNGALEYITWRVLDQAVDWRVLRDGRYELLTPGEDGVLRSEVFPGLWLEPTALLRGELAVVLEVLQQGLASPAHAAFVARLQPAGE